VIKMTSSPAARETQPIGSSGGETSPEAVAWGSGVEDMSLAGPADEPSLYSTCVWGLLLAAAQPSADCSSAFRRWPRLLQQQCQGFV